MTKRKIKAGEHTFEIDYKKVNYKKRAEFYEKAIHTEIKCMETMIHNALCYSRENPATFDNYHLMFSVRELKQNIKDWQKMLEKGGKL